MLACKGIAGPTTCIAGPTTYLLVANVVNVFKASTAVDLIPNCTQSKPEMVAIIMMVVALMELVMMKLSGNFNCIVCLVLAFVCLLRELP